MRAQHPAREKDVIRFTLQCITAMFAEDIGLLPKNYFTSLLYNGAKSGDIERRLHELFTQMNTPDLPAPRVVPYFNGGLFTDVTTLPLGDTRVRALTKAAEANWTYVDPHIFGSVFQGIMDDAERHASGAHYTAHDDTCAWSARRSWSRGASASWPRRRSRSAPGSSVQVAFESGEILPSPSTTRRQRALA